VLTQKQQCVIDRFTDVCVRDDRISAAFVGGSIAAATADEHSDLDLYALIRPEAYDQLLSQHRHFVEQWASPVFLEHFDGFGFDMLVFILQDGIQGELGIAKPNRFLHIHGGAYAVLVDKEELLDGVKFPLQRPEREHQLRVLRKQMHWFWRDLSLWNVAMRRRHPWTAAGYVESMRRRCVRLVRLQSDFASWAEDYEKLEQVVGEDELELIRASFSTLETEAMVEAVRNLVVCYKEVASRLASRYGLEYPSSLQDTLLGKTTGLLGRLERDPQ
jgi:hypothetical protein